MICTQSVRFLLSVQTGSMVDSVPSLFPRVSCCWAPFSSGALGDFLIAHERLKNSTAPSAYLPSLL